MLNSSESGLYALSATNEAGGCDPVNLASCVLNMGVPLSGASEVTTTFMFDIFGELRDDDVIPFQVGMYYTGNNGQIKRNLLSATLVPEPSSVALLGIGVFMLAGMAAWRRRCKQR